ncbi:MAG: GspE/PulE family protein, partial [Vicinamibacteria bacterium]
MATPLTGTRPAASRDPSATGDRRLRLDDILKLMAADGLVTRADADKLARARTKQYEHPLELVAAQHWRSTKAPHVQLTLDWLVEWLAGKLGVPYRHIDPLKIDLTAVTQTMSNAYAERFRILPVAVSGNKLIVATAEPFVTSWAKELGPILKMDVELEFANPVDIKRFLGEFYNLARSMKKASEAQPGQISLARNFEQLVELGKRGNLDANDSHVVHITDWLWQYAFEQRASDIHIEPRRDVGLVRFRIDGVLHQVYAIPTPVLIAMTSRIKLLARMEIVEKRRPQDGRIKTVAPSGQEVELRIATMPTAFGEKIVMRIFTPEVLVRDYTDLGFTPDDQSRWELMIKEPNGIILVTGPTGSGKTSTLYAALSAISTRDKSIVSVEDPV